MKLDRFWKHLTKLIGGVLLTLSVAHAAPSQSNEEKLKVEELVEEKKQKSPDPADNSSGEVLQEEIEEFTDQTPREADPGSLSDTLKKRKSLEEEKPEETPEELSPAPKIGEKKSIPKKATQKSLEPPQEKLETPEASTKKVPDQFEESAEPLDTEIVVVEDGKKKKKIKHPLSKKGLYKITADGEYLYRTEEHTPKYRTASLRFGSMELENFRNPENESVNFEEVYGDSGTAVVFGDYEWNLFHTVAGRMGWKYGAGVMVASGSGHFVDGSQAQEQFTFLVIPNSLSVIYRFQFWDAQYFVPYIEGGGDYFVFVETRDDDKGVKYGASPGGHVAGGIHITLTGWSRAQRQALAAEYGISNLFLTLEYRALVGFNESMDITSQVFNGGFSVDF